MPHLSLMQWDWKDQLQATASQIVNDGTPETTYYRYDGAGQRIVKATYNQSGTIVSRRVYLGAYELYREYGAGGAIRLERETLHVTDGKQRISIVETVTVDTSTTAAEPQSPLLRYQLGNHLGSAVVELDGAAALLSYEEYYPYGSTSFQSGASVAEVGLKRYRYTGKERDTENAFYYYGARYGVPWLGRWLGCDPAGLVDGVSLYTFVRCNPIRLRDPNGRQSEVASAKEALEGAKRENEQAKQEAEKLSQRVMRLEDRQVQLLLGPRSKAARLELRAIEQEFLRLHPLLTAAIDRADAARSSPVATKQAPTDEQKSTPDAAKAAPKTDTSSPKTDKEPLQPDAKLHIDAQVLGTYNSSTITGKTSNPAFGSLDPQLTYIPFKDLSLPIPHLPDDLKLLHEPALTVPLSFQFKSTGTEVHPQPGLQVDAVDYTLGRFEGKLTFGYQLDLYHLKNVGDNSQFLGQASVAFKLIPEPGDGKKPGFGLDLTVQGQKGFWPGTDPHTYPWAAAVGATGHFNLF